MYINKERLIMTIGYIYRLFCVDPAIKDEYIGSTTNFRQRKCSHKKTCNNANDGGYNCRVYQFIRSNGGWNNFRMDLVEEVEFENRMELNRREGEIIQSRGATLNSLVAGRTYVETCRAYRETNREKINERHRVYREVNRETLNDKQKEKFECMCGGRYTKVNKSVHFRTAKHIKNFEQGLYEYINS